MVRENPGKVNMDEDAPRSPVLLIAISIFAVTQPSSGSWPGGRTRFYPPSVGDSMITVACDASSLGRAAGPLLLSLSPGWLQVGSER